MATYSDGGGDILSEQNPLGLDDKEVDELMNIANQSIESLPRNGIVLSGTELSREAVVQDGLAGDLGSDGDTQDHPRELETPSDNIEVADGKDASNDDGIGDGRGTFPRYVNFLVLEYCLRYVGKCGLLTRVIPREKLGEERVVVGQGLAGSSRVGWSSAGSGEVGQLGSGLRMLVLGILSNGACGKEGS